MKKTMAYVGTYSEKGVFAFEVSEGLLKPAHEPARIQNPAYFAFSGKRYMYAVLEYDRFEGLYGGAVAAFEIGAEGVLRLINTQPTHGRASCHLCLDTRGGYLFAANYMEGTVTMFPLGGDGSILPCTHIERHKGSGPNPKRQEAPHAHCAVMTPGGAELCVVDLGIDSIRVYQIDREAGRLIADEARSLRLRPGCGPRHLIFAPGGRTAYVVCELGNEVVALRFDPQRGFEVLGCCSTLPEGWRGESTAAALTMTPDGKYLYASNRGHDSIAAFRAAADGRLERIGIFPSGGRCPRDIQVTPDGRFLYSANQLDGTLTGFQIDGGTGVLSLLEETAKADSPVCIKFLEIDSF